MKQDLVADIGGTHARFALVAPSGELHDIKTFHCDNYPGPVEAARSYLRDVGCTEPPGRAAFAVATAVTGDTVQMTNNAWTISAPAVAAALGLSELRLLNDFEALALALPYLTATEYVVCGDAQPGSGQALAVVGPGTGLGVAGVIWTPAGWIAVPGEGGHTTLPASDEFEWQVLAAARRLHDPPYAHISAERLLSGRGLPLLARAVAAVQNLPQRELEAEEITQGAIDGDALCAATLDLFCALLGTFAGNVALTLGARGGLFIGGGILPRVQGLFSRSRFRERFEAKGRMRPYNAAIPTALITAPYPALRGAASALTLRAFG